MRILSVVAVALAALPAFAEAPPDPKAEWPKKLETLNQLAAREHAAVGKFATSKKLHNEAFPEYERAAELDPQNADAQKGLGRKLEDGAWVADPKTPPKKGAEAAAADVPKILDDIASKRRDLATKLAKAFTTLAEWADKNGLKPEGAGLWRQVLDRYDPVSEKAHVALGYVKDGTVWVPPGDAAKREDAAKKLKDADKGEIVKDRSEVENALGVSHAKRRSTHFFVEGPWGDAQVAEMVQISETARALFLEMFDEKPDAFAEEIHAIVFKDRDTYGRYVTADSHVPDRDKKAYIAAAGYPVLNPPGYAVWIGARDWDYTRDVVAHMTVHILFCEYFNKFPVPAWLYEGLSYRVTDRLFKSAKIYCSGFSTGAGGDRNFEDVRDWKPEMKRLERDRQDPDLPELFASDLAGMNMRRSMKAWSVVDWMVEERKKEFIAFIAELRSKPPDEAAQAAFGVRTLGELDSIWEKYVREKY